MFWRRTRLRTERLAVATDGLLRRGHPELRIEVNDAKLLRPAKHFLRFVFDYLSKSGRQIRAGETLRYGYWLVKFVSAEGRQDLLDVQEYDADATKFVPGGSLAVRYWTDQHRVCRRHRALFVPPDPDAMTDVSSGVFEGRPVQAMRYPWPAPSSGWVIVTDEYDGDVAKLTRHHTYHVTSARPDLAPYLALPSGFGFELLRDEARVIYDEELLKEHLREWHGEKAVEDAGFPKKR